MDTRQTLADLAINEFRCPPEKINGNSTIKELGIDSLGLLEFIFRIEEVFDIRIDNDETEKLKTLADIVDLVDRLRPPVTA